MSLTIHGNRTGAAARTERLDFAYELAQSSIRARLEKARKEHEEVTRKALVIRDFMGQEAYDLWLNSTPDDNSGFDLALDEKYTEVLAAQAAAESERISEWLGVGEAVQIAYGEAVAFASEVQAQQEVGREALLDLWELEARDADLGTHVSVSGGEVQER